MSTTAQGTSIRCDAPNCALPATIEEGAWGFCATHAGKGTTDKTTGAATDRTHLSRAHTPAVIGTGSISTAAPAASAPMVQIMGGGTIGLLLEQASGHSNRRVTTLAAKIETQLEQLRQHVASLAEDEKRKTAEHAAKTAAKAKVERLQAELAAARAALRGNKPPTTKPTAPAAPKTTSTPESKTCAGCGADIVREAGRPGWLPARCPNCRPTAA